MKIKKEKSNKFEDFINYFSFACVSSFILICGEFIGRLDVINSYNQNLFHVFSTMAFLSILSIPESAIISFIFIIVDSVLNRIINNNHRISKYFVFITVNAIIGVLFFSLIDNSFLADYTHLIPIGIFLASIFLIIYIRNNANLVLEIVESIIHLFRRLCLPILLFSFAFSLFLFAPQFHRFSDTNNNDGENNLPNIVLIYADALSAEDMFITDYYLETSPNMHTISNNFSSFSNAYASTTCSVNHFPSIMTGKYPLITDYYEYGERVREDENWKYLPTILKDLGYRNYWVNWWLPFGFYNFDAAFDGSLCFTNKEDFLQQTFFSYYLTLNGQHWKFPLITRTKPFKFLNYQTCWDYSKLIDFLENKELVLQQSPFFIYIHYQGVHGIPYPSGDFLGSILPIEDGLISREDQMEYYGEYDPSLQPFVDKLRLRYDESILNNDQKLKEMVDAFKRNNLFENSIIIISSDHGQNFNEGFSGHCTPLVSNSEIHIPFFLKLPYQQKGEIINDAISAIDVFPTILDYLNIEYQDEWFDGKSLLEFRSSNEDRSIISVRTIFGKNKPLFISEIKNGQKNIRILDQTDCLEKVY